MPKGRLKLRTKEKAKGPNRIKRISKKTGVQKEKKEKETEREKDEKEAIGEDNLRGIKPDETRRVQITIGCKHIDHTQR